LSDVVVVIKKKTTWRRQTAGIVRHGRSENEERGLGHQGRAGSAAVGGGEGLAGGALLEWSRIGEVGTNAVMTGTGLAAVADGKRERE